VILLLAGWLWSLLIIVDQMAHLVGGLAVRFAVSTKRRYTHRACLINRIFCLRCIYTLAVSFYIIIIIINSVPRGSYRITAAAV